MPPIRAGEALLVAVLALSAPPRAIAGNDPSGVVLLVNEDSPDSVAVAAHYAAARSLPERQVVRLHVPLKPEISLAEFRATVEEPLRAHLLREGIEQRARCLVLTRGIPVRVAPGQGQVSTAALLQCMDLPIAGLPQAGIPGAPFDIVPPEQRANPYREGPFPEDRRPGGVALRLVTSLDGWSSEDAKGLVDRSVAADAGPPADPLFLFQEAGGGAAGRNASYAEGVSALRVAGYRTETLPGGADRVRGRKDLMGWISGGCYSGLDDAGVASNRFAPGALVDMLESFGAVPQNFDEKAGRSQFPVPVMVRAGASGVHGAVAEPYAHTFPDTRLFARYTSGLDLAESFHGSLPYLYWMNLVLGDPLCAPFARRPKVEVEGLPESIRSAGAIRFRVKAAAAPGGEAPESLEVFSDGRSLGTAPGASGEFALDPAALPDGERVVLAVARCGGATRTRGWCAKRLTVDLARARIVRWDPQPDAAAAPPKGPFSAEWSGRESPREPSLALLDDGGRPVPAACVPYPARRRLVLTPSAPLSPGRTYALRAAGFGEPAPSATFVAGAAALTVRAPAEVAAGEPLRLTVTAEDAEGAPRSPLAGERIEVRAADPPVLLAWTDLPADLAVPAEVVVVLRRTGRANLSVLARRSGASARVPVTVRPGPPASLFLRIASSTPIGEPFDVPVQAMDALGNPVQDWTGTVTLAAPQDPRAEIPGPVEVKAGDGGRALFRGVAFGTPGRQVLAATAPGGLSGTDDTMAEATTLRRWFVAGPFEGTAVPGDDAVRRPADGAVLGDRPWRFQVAGTPLLDPGRGKGTFLALAYLSFPREEEVVLHLGHGGALRAWLAGKAVYDGPAAAQAAAERGTVKVKVAAGFATLAIRALVRGDGQDSFGVLVTLPDGSPVPGLRVLAKRPFPAPSLSIAGIVRDAKGPVAGAEVHLSGPKSLRTRTDALGWYGFGDLRPGSYRVTTALKGRRVEPESRAVDLKDAEAVGVDFEARDAK